MENVEYTVKQTAKINRERFRDPRPSIWLSVAKWLIAVILFLSVLACVVASKVCLVSIGQIYTNNESNKNSGERETLFVMLVLVLWIPEAFAFFRSCWGSLLRSSHPWPSRKAIVVVRC